MIKPIVHAFGAACLDFVDGTDDSLDINIEFNVHVDDVITTETVGFTKQLYEEFENNFTHGYYHLDLAEVNQVILPDTIVLFFVAEELPRIGRELLISYINDSIGRLSFAIWQTSKLLNAIRSVAFGGLVEPLDATARRQLRVATRAAKRKLKAGTIVVFDPSLYERMGPIIEGVGSVFAHSLKWARGIIIREEVDARCDFFITEDPASAESAKLRGARATMSILEARAALFP